MGGTVGTDSAAVAVPLLSEVRQDLVLSYHLFGKNSQRCPWFNIVNLTHFGPYVTVNRFFPIIIKLKHVHEAHQLLSRNEKKCRRQILWHDDYSLRKRGLCCRAAVRLSGRVEDLLCQNARPHSRPRSGATRLTLGSTFDRQMAFPRTAKIAQNASLLICITTGPEQADDGSTRVLATYWRMPCFCCLMNGNTCSSDVHSAYKLVAYYCQKWLTVWHWQQ